MNFLAQPLLDVYIYVTHLNFSTHILSNFKKKPHNTPYYSTFI